MDNWAHSVAVVSSKLAVAGAAVPASVYIVPMWGASIFSFGLAAIGSVMSYAWDKPEKDRRMLIFKTVSVTLFSVALVVVLPDLAGWELKPVSEPPLAFIIATFGRHIILGIKKAAPSIGEAFAGYFRRRDSYGDDYQPGGRGYEEDGPADPRPDPRNKTNSPPEDY